MWEGGVWVRVVQFLLCLFTWTRLFSLIASFCYLTSRVSGSRLGLTRRREEQEQHLVSRRGLPLDADGKVSWLSAPFQTVFHHVSRSWRARPELETRWTGVHSCGTWCLSSWSVTMQEFHISVCCSGTVQILCCVKWKRADMQHVEALVFIQKWQRRTASACSGGGKLACSCCDLTGGMSPGHECVVASPRWKWSSFTSTMIDSLGSNTWWAQVMIISSAHYCFRKVRGRNLKGFMEIRDALLLQETPNPQHTSKTSFHAGVGPHGIMGNFVKAELMLLKLKTTCLSLNCWNHHVSSEALMSNTFLL